MQTMHRSRFLRTLIIVMTAALLMSLASAAQADELGVVMGGRLHLRAEPSMDATILATYDSGTHVQITEQQGDWLHVQAPDGEAGYMEAKFVYVSSLGVVENGNSYVNLRTQPSRNAKVIGQYSTGTTVTLLSETGTGWLYVDIGGTQGYMAGNFVKPAPADVQPQPVSTRNSGTNTNPYELAINGENDVVHQVGQSETEMYFDEKLAYTIYYPQLGIPVADEAIKQWVDRTIADAMDMSNEEGNTAQVELTAQYDSYLMDNRYIGVMITGFSDSMMVAHPSDLIYTINVDQQTGSILTYKDIFTTGRTQDVLNLVHTKLAQGGDDPVEGLTMDETWLEYTLLTPDGVSVVLPKAEFIASAWGTQSVLLPYEELTQMNLLAFQLLPVPVQAAPSTTAPSGPAQAHGAIDPTKPMIALTFDDGPSDYTTHILDILKQHNARATFCMVGNRIANYKDVVAQVAQSGSEIATHTWSHKQLTNISQAEIESQLKKSMNAITAITGEPVTVLRPPYGSVNSDVRAVCRKLGLTIATWSIDTEDWKTNNADSTYNAIMNHVQNGSIILCHDVKHSTSIAMERVIPELVARGYQLVTVTELLSFSQTHGQAGTVYNHLDTSHLEGGS